LPVLTGQMSILSYNFGQKCIKQFKAKDNLSITYDKTRGFNGIKSHEIN
jgi:hypothetical protein